MSTMTVPRVSQRMLFSEEEMGVKGVRECGGVCAASMDVREYVHTRDFLWRMLACFPGDMPFVEAVERVPEVVFGRKEVAL